MRPRLAVRAVCYQQDKILVCHHVDARGDWYILPGGGVEHGETLLEAFNRELKEELGASALMHDVIYIREIMSSRETQHYLPENFHQIEMFFETTNMQFVHSPTNQDPNQIGYCWVSLSELEKTLFFPKELIPHLIQRNKSKVYLGNIV